ncbi:MAG: glycosyltransferase [Synechococcaceae bacterium WB9_2_112]|nr:glycosyltransferase [Synechococcaceae bacterium WB9_2_112]
MRILITAYDLEQVEHRGIAVYSKGLIHCLAEAGAEIWLLTQFALPKQPRVPSNLDGDHRSAEIDRLVDLFDPSSSSSSSSRLGGRLALLGLARKLFEIVQRVLISVPYLVGSRIYRRADMRYLKLKDLRDPGRLDSDRLFFLRRVSGFVCAPNLYRASQIAALVPVAKPFRVDCEGFDFLVTACPLFIRPASGRTKLVQTVHDLIPLQYYGSGNRYLFLRTLLASSSAQRIFVSCATSRLFYEYFGSRRLVNGRLERVPDCVLFQRPSLAMLDGDVSRTELLGRVGEEGLKPFKYILFNSFIEPRKNVEFLIRVFGESGLASEGYQLCIVGKKQQLAYSQSIEELSRQTAGVRLVGYVDEVKKAALFLYAGMLASPSHLEGFGIPVLDAACLGLPVMASTCEAYQELFDYRDFSRYMTLISIDRPAEWVQSLGAVKLRGECDPDMAELIVQQRLSRYRRKTGIIEAEMMRSLQRVIAQF